MILGNVGKIYAIVCLLQNNVFEVEKLRQKPTFLKIQKKINVHLQFRSTKFVVISKKPKFGPFFILVQRFHRRRIHRMKMKSRTVEV